MITPAELEAVRDYIDFVRGLQCQLDEKVAEQLAAAFVEASRAEPGFDMDRFNTCVTVRGGGTSGGSWHTAESTACCLVLMFNQHDRPTTTNLTHPIPPRP